MTENLPESVTVEPVVEPGTLGCACGVFERPDTEDGRSEIAAHYSTCPAVAAAEAAYVAPAPVEPVAVPTYESNGVQYLIIGGVAVRVAS